MILYVKSLKYDSCLLCFATVDGIFRFVFHEMWLFCVQDSPRSVRRRGPTGIPSCEHCFIS